MPKQILKKIYSINTLVAINKTATNKLSHSTQVYDRILKVANSKANLAGKDNAKTKPESEAIQFRIFNYENELDY
jgi:predicted ATPase with chaperone activity